VHGGDQQVRQGVGDLPLPLVHQRGQQGQHQRPGMVALCFLFFVLQVG
jgi:hypothetical protein